MEFNEESIMEEGSATPPEDESAKDESAEDEQADEAIDWKAKALEAQGRLKRLETKMSKASEKKEENLIKNEKQGDIDYGHLTFFNSKTDVKITDDEDIEYVKEMMKETGLDQKTLLNKKWFQAEIKERQESKIVKEAIPSNSRRATTSARNTVEYWLNKGELPPADQVQLRRDVVNAKIEREKNSSKFGRTSFSA